jgi:peptidoglycan/LPS O-acetylase OafA/YrhL
MGRHVPLCPVEVSSLFHRISELWFRGGWIGVDLFFVLSGFLVSGLLFREHEKFGCISAKNFLLRRGLKIYPPFWILISATVVVMAFRDHEFYPQKIVSELLFIQNYGPALWNHTWSLAIEEHFYLLLLLFLLLLSRHHSGAQAFRVVPAAFIILAILCLALRVLTAYVASYSAKTHLFPSHLRMDSLFAGVFISYLYHFHRDRFLEWGGRHRLKLLLAGTLLLCPAFVFWLGFSRFVITFGLTLIYIGSGFLLIVALVSRVPRHRTAKALAYAGSHSYSIYLWHMPVALWIVPNLNRWPSLGQNWFVYTGAYLVVAISFGILMAALIEFPVLRMRDHFFPSRGRPLTVSTVRHPGGEELPSPPSDDERIAVETPTAVQLESGSAALPIALKLRAVARDLESDG